MLAPRKEWRRWPSAGLLKGPSPWARHRHADSTQPSPLYSQRHLRGEHLICRYKSYHSIDQSYCAQQPAQEKVTAVASLSLPSVVSPPSEQLLGMCNLCFMGHRMVALWYREREAMNHFCKRAECVQYHIYCDNIQ